MIWSKKLRIFRERLAPALQKRTALRSAGYRDAYEERGRSWIEFDGREVISFCDFVHENAWREHGRDLAAVAAAGVYSKQDFGSAFTEFIDLGIDSALASGNPLIRGLAVLDRRVGRRRLRTLAATAQPEPVETLLKLRLAAEGMSQIEVGQIAAP
jgi:hypothetical protein